MMEFIRQANLSSVRELLTPENAYNRDRSGRSPLHMAVLYERKFVIKFLLKEYPAAVHLKDDVSHLADTNYNLSLTVSYHQLPPATHCHLSLTTTCH